MTSKQKRAAIAAAIAAAGICGYAVAQTNYPVISKLTGAELVQVVPATAGLANNPYISVLNIANYMQGASTTIANCTIPTGVGLTTSCTGSLMIVTTPNLTQATLAPFTVSLFNNAIVYTTSLVECQIQYYTASVVTNGIPTIVGCSASLTTPGVITASLLNAGTTSLNGGLVISFEVLN